MHHYPANSDITLPEAVEQLLNVVQQIVINQSALFEVAKNLPHPPVDHVGYHNILPASPAGELY